MATEYTLRRADGKPFGTFKQVRALVRQLFPDVQFTWTTSGPEKLKLAKQRGIKFPPELKKVLKTLPSLLEGVVEGEGYHLTIGLGHQEPVPCLYVTPRGDSPELDSGLTALESKAGAEFKVAGDE